MGPMWFAGCCDQIKLDIKDIMQILPQSLVDEVSKNEEAIKPNKDAGAPELAREWNICKEAVRLLVWRYINAD